MSLSWWKLNLYSGGEYVFDAVQSSDSFFHDRSELAVVPVGWFHVGLGTRRTRVYDTNRDIRLGLFVNAGYRNVEAATHVFNADDGAPTVVGAVGMSF